MEPTTTPRPRVRRLLRIAAGVVGVVVVAWLAAWGIDTAVAGDDSARNLVVAGTPVGSLSQADVTAAVAGVADGYGDTEVSAVTPNGTFTATADDAGVAVDVDATVAAVMASGSDVAPLARPFAWVASLFSTTEVPVVMDVDAAKVAASPLAQAAEANTDPATEPGLVADGASVAVVPGSDGSAITIDQLVAALRDAATSSGVGAVSVTLQPQPASPRFSDDAAQALADWTNVALADPVTVVTGGVSTVVEAPTLARWLVAVPGPNSLELGVDADRVIADLNATGTVGRPEVPVSFVVTDGVVSTVGGTGAVTCCEPESTQQIVTALTTPERVAELKVAEQPLQKGPEWAASLGIVTPVGSFTTNYPAGQDRAINIVRIAEIIRGTVIEPGATFSVNETTGPRTREQGFVDGGIIVNGVVSSGVGGGISQFATTLFNAAFFAGLDIPEFMMHTIYISRYPYGREATLAWPSVDLKITNNTPYGILIWPESTPDSITVTLYSTPWIVGEQTGQTTEPAGECTKVTTERTRRWLVDNRVETDVFIGRYQPREGVQC